MGHLKPSGAERRSGYATAVSVIALAVFYGTVPGQAAFAQTTEGKEQSRTWALNIPSQALSTSLLALSEQMDLLVVATPDLIAAKQAPELKGQLSLQDALDRLFKDSGLAYEVTADRQLILHRTEARPGSALETGGSAMFTSLETNPGEQIAHDASDDMSPRKKPAVALDLEEIVVTGSNIRGANVIGSKLFVFDQEDIRRTGFSSVQDVVQSLPQNFGGGPNAMTAPLQGTENGAQFANRNFGASINLRGLGAGSTLTVINGRRIAAAGGGTFVDISALPLSAVERIEVLPDGASAIYGTDAIAGVTNIILKQNYEGAETRLRYGTVTEGRQQEYKASQLFGTNWQGGGLVLSYEYQKIEPLFSEERDFSASSDLRSLGGSDYRLPFSNPGTLLAGGKSFAIPQGQDGTSLTAGDFISSTANLGNDRRGTTLFPKQERHSFYGHLHQELSGGLRVFAETLYTTRKFEARRPAKTLTLTVPATNPFYVNPVGGLSPVQVRYSFLDDLGPQIDQGRVESYALVAGASLDLSAGWQTELTGTYNGSSENGGLRSGAVNMSALTRALADPNPRTAFNPFGDGSHSNPATLKQISGYSTTNRGFDLWTLDVKSDGPLFALPGGMVKLALGGHYRKESWLIERLDFELASDTKFSVAQDMTRDVRAAFTELLVPLVGDGNRLPGIERLDLSAAFRLEDYSDFGSTRNPRFGLAWSPLPGLSLRGTYGTSFRAPILSQRDTSLNQVFFFPLRDPKSPRGLSNAILLTGNDPDLGPETATTWTVGVDFRPVTLPRFNLSLTYFDTRFKDRLGQVTDLGLLAKDDIFAPLIMRNPAAANTLAYFADPKLVNVVGSTDPAAVDAIVNARLTNIGRSLVRGLDVTTQYGLTTGVGDFILQVNGSLLFDFKESVTDTAPYVDLVDTLDRPVDWRLRSSLSWAYGGFTTTVFVNYTDSYKNKNIIPAETVSSWTTADLTVSYWTGDQSARPWLRDLGFTFSAINVTNARPPFVDNPRGIGFDPEKASPQGRFLAFEITKRW
ncbi:TonB-dependent receptor [Govanella unica]|uniref:TonB-dependent receptor n=1 Tax=Govanella unica TaxID=2975056 RepID=A0A9X3TXR0_9PROT|nr:TonB-dependent receptor [Govania unica]MDA5193678.1 TonB-dependent receptor [Govania unica]